MLTLNLRGGVGCQVLSGLLTKFGLPPRTPSLLQRKHTADHSNSIRHAVTDDGGGVPNAAKELGVDRSHCGLHCWDLVQGWALGLKGKWTSREEPVLSECKAMFERVKKERACAKVFSKSTLVSDKLTAIQLEIKEALEIAELLGVGGRRCPVQSGG